MHTRSLFQGPGTGPLDQSINTALQTQAQDGRWIPQVDLWIEQTVDITLLLLLIFVIARGTQALRKLVIVPMIRKTNNTIDDAFVDKAVFRWLSYMLPTLIASSAIEHLPGLDPSFESSQDIVRIARQVLTAMTTLTGMLAVGGLIDAAHEIYSRRSGPNQRPIKGYVSLVKIFIYVIGIVAAVAWAFGKDPTGLLTGIGAMTAVLMLVFKDTILSLVASITLTQNDMVRLGDWIEVPGGADGDVVDMALHTVKIQNFDRTISTVPTINLVNKPFKNWRNMSQGQGRRIKRSIKIDASSVRFLNHEEIEHHGKVSVLKDYIEGKLTELRESNKATDPSAPPLEVRRLTNIGTFRAYIYKWLHKHPMIHQGMTLLVRQLEPTATGLPIEIYAFTRTTAWGEYEEIMADLFDFLLAAVHEFDLRIYQDPTGQDLRAALSEGPRHVG